MIYLYYSKYENTWLGRRVEQGDTEEPWWWADGEQWDMAGTCEYFTLDQIKFLTGFEDVDIKYWYLISHCSETVIGPPPPITKTAFELVQQLIIELDQLAPQQVSAALKTIRHQLTEDN